MTRAYWVGEAHQGTDYQDLEATPESVTSTSQTLAANAVHLARLLNDNPCPPS
ncbi:hypothetical protein [Streptomyces decoyicus]|uniref:hypothetical protein n=1 Tax=Streptomyces decoyicus TaxID=249567 RepID=UPI000A3DD149